MLKRKAGTVHRNKKGADAGFRQTAPLKRKLFFLRGGSGGLRARRGGQTGFGHLARAETLREFLHASGGVDKFLLTGEKGMAGRANAEAEILFGGAGVIDRAAGADDLAFHIFGVDIRFHGSREKYLNLKGEQAPSGSVAPSAGPRSQISFGNASCSSRNFI